MRRWHAAESAETWANFEWLVGATTRIQRAQGVPDETYGRQRMHAMVPQWISAAQTAIEEFESMRTVLHGERPATDVPSRICTSMVAGNAIIGATWED